MGDSVYGTQFYEDRAVVYEEEAVYVIDKDGYKLLEKPLRKPIIENQTWDEAYDSTPHWKDRFVIFDGRYYGIMDVDGNWLVKPMFYNLIADHKDFLRFILAIKRDCGFEEGVKDMMQIIGCDLTREGGRMIGTTVLAFLAGLITSLADGDAFSLSLGTGLLILTVILLAVRILRLYQKSLFYGRSAFSG